MTRDKCEGQVGGGGQDVVLCNKRGWLKSGSGQVRPSVYLVAVLSQVQEQARLAHKARFGESEGYQFYLPNYKRASFRVCACMCSTVARINCMKKRNN